MVKKITWSGWDNVHINIIVVICGLFGEYLEGAPVTLLCLSDNCPNRSGESYFLSICKTQIAHAQLQITLQVSSTEARQEADVEETRHQKQESYGTPAQDRGEKSAADINKHTLTCTWVRRVPAWKSFIFSQDGTEARKLLSLSVSLCLLCSSTWRDSRLGAFNLHRAV